MFILLPHGTSTRCARPRVNQAPQRCANSSLDLNEKEMISYLSGPLVGNARAGWVASVSGNAWSLISGGLACVFGVLLCVPTLPAFWRYNSSTWLQTQGLEAPGLPASPEESR